MTKTRFTLLFSGLFLLFTNTLIANELNSVPTEQVTKGSTVSTPTTNANEAIATNVLDTKNRYVYQVNYKSISIGKMTQEYHWTGKDVEVNSVADFSFLYFSFGGSQKSDIDWDEQQKLFLSRSFFRQSVGFSVVDMTVNFDKDGRKTHVVNNGEKAEYTNDSAPIVDFNTITLQISEGLKAGQIDFEFYMQTSTSVAHYFFKVVGKEKIKTKFGELEAYRVEQVRKNDRTFIAWFAPTFENQMVKFHYKRKVLDINGELIEHNNTKLQ
ncbi:DUF3108 domain-containing protein [Psychromonas sp. RZ22]|uniref:DUF3108 domain-containing protein n=1 Tax=Psychromonas algarum TaxID=2555643 RepID=UPI001067B7FD|nr:DUF3108 domain-containing protein [Psychromonas sp. RZ22]TEW53772.1 DUF3108 domain-containing protein [Psychromonas sp. RZ22]